MGGRGYPKHLQKERKKESKEEGLTDTYKVLTNNIETQADTHQTTHEEPNADTPSPPPDEIRIKEICGAVYEAYGKLPKPSEVKKHFLKYNSADILHGLGVYGPTIEASIKPPLKENEGELDDDEERRLNIEIVNQFFHEGRGAVIIDSMRKCADDPENSGAE